MEYTINGLLTITDDAFAGWLVATCYMVIMNNYVVYAIIILDRSILAAGLAGGLSGLAANNLPRCTAAARACKEWTRMRQPLGYFEQHFHLDRHHGIRRAGMRSATSAVVRAWYQSRAYSAAPTQSLQVCCIALFRV